MSVTGLHETLRDLAREAPDVLGTPPDLLRRPRRRPALRRAGSILAAAAVALGAVAGVQAVPGIAARHVGTVETDIFQGVHGWLAYGTRRGVFAVYPRAGGWEHQVQLSDGYDLPLAWSPDGSHLLCARFRRGRGPALVVLNADGGVRTVSRGLASPFTASLSPDGSTILYAGLAPDASFSYRALARASGVYLVGVDGAGGRLLATGHRQWYTYEHKSYSASPHQPVFSPDGTEVAYFDGMGDWGNGLRVADVDGGRVRVLISPDGPFAKASWLTDLTWSADGSHLNFMEYDGGIWRIDADGSGLTRLPDDARAGSHPQWSPTRPQFVFERGGGIWLGDAHGAATEIVDEGRDPVLSPDGTRLAYWVHSNGEGIEVTRRDGTHQQSVGPVYGIPVLAWNPLPLSASPPYSEPTTWDDSEREPRVTESPPADASSHGVGTWISAIATAGLVGLGGIGLAIWTRRRAAHHR